MGIQILSLMERSAYLKTFIFRFKLHLISVLSLCLSVSGAGWGVFLVPSCAEGEYSPWERELQQGLWLHRITDEDTVGTFKGIPATTFCITNRKKNNLTRGQFLHHWNWFFHMSLWNYTFWLFCFYLEVGNFFFFLYIGISKTETCSFMTWENCIWLFTKNTSSFIFQLDMTGNQNITTQAYVNGRQSFSGVGPVGDLHELLVLQFGIHFPAWAVSEASSKIL